MTSARVHEYWIRVTAEPRKAAVLGGLMLVLVVMGTRMMLKGGPSSARAQGELAVASPTDTMNSLLDLSILDGGGPEVLIERAPNPERNVFGFDERYFPIPAPAEDLGPEDSPKDESDQDDNTEAQPSQEELRAALVAEAERRIEVKSTLVGSNPVAVIEVIDNGKRERRVVGIDQAVDGFIVRRVTAHGVVLERDGVLIEIRRVLPER